MSTQSGFLAETFASLRKDPLGMMGLIIIVVILLATVFASQLAISPLAPAPMAGNQRHLTAIKRNSLLDRVTAVMSVAFIAIPSFVVAINVSTHAGYYGGVWLLSFH